MSGTVYLVGAGPGDPELITVRGLKCLQQADIVVYDRLANEALLDEAPLWAERVYVGKTSGSHAMKQEDINTLLVHRAAMGQTVVRLKGGDPFVFGRGGEEAQACARAGVSCRVIPGISSAISVPASVGIPVTHRGIAGSVAIVTGHRKPEQDDVNWAAMARVDTLVILMGVERLAYIVEQLKQHSPLPDTPVAIIESGTLPDERTVIGTLETIVDQSAAANVSSPATIVVGEVVRLSEGTTLRDVQINELTDKSANQHTASR